MRRWETFAALGAVVAALLGTIHAIPDRFVLTALAIVTLVAVAASRLIGPLIGKKRATGFDPNARAEAIRRARERRSR